MIHLQQKMFFLKTSTQLTLSTAYLSLHQSLLQKPSIKIFIAGGQVDVSSIFLQSFNCWQFLLFVIAKSIDSFQLLIRKPIHWLPISKGFPHRKGYYYRYINIMLYILHTRWFFWSQKCNKKLPMAQIWKQNNQRMNFNKNTKTFTRQCLFDFIAF